MSDADALQSLFENPLLPEHRERPEVEFQAYDQIDIVSTFGQPQAEYAALRKGCGLIDLPQRGILELTGKDRLPFLNNLLSNEIWNKSTKRGLEAGQGVYAFFLNVRGRIVADMNILERGDRTLIETDARKIELLRLTWDRYLFTEQVKMTNQRATLHEIALHGPASGEVLKSLAGDAIELTPLQSRAVTLFGVEIIVWRDDVCAVPGFHLIVPRESAQQIWSGIESRFAEPSELGKRVLRPVGWAAFNAARVEAGRPLLDIDFPGAVPDRPGGMATSGGHVVRDSTPSANPTVDKPATTTSIGVLPAELGPTQFGRAINLSKCYVGQEVVARMHARKQVARMIVGIRMPNDALPVAGAKVFDEASNEIGVVTSSTVSPILSNTAICLSYVKRPFFDIGTRVILPAEGAMREGVVVETPFVQI